MRQRWLVPAAMALAVAAGGVGWGCAGGLGQADHTAGPPLADLTPERIVDLTHAFDAQTIYWPTATPFSLEVMSEGDTPAGFYYSANRFCAAEHGGTHIDAPIHFHRQRPRVDEIPLDQLIGPGVVIDVTAACDADRDHAVNVADIERWEAAHGRVPAGAIVLIRTGWARFWPDAEKYMGTAERGDEAVKNLHFPGLDGGAATWLVKERGVKLVGIDTASIDPGQSRLFRSHVLLFTASVPALENVANLDKLPAKGFTVIALPMKIRGGTGGPTRIVAILP